MAIDVHQHLWTQPLVEALAARHELPFIRRERGLDVLHLAGECPYVIDMATEEPGRRSRTLDDDGISRALVAISSPVGIEALPREQAAGLLEAYLDGALALPWRFGVWGAIALDGPDCDDVDVLLDRGCVGLSLPAGALARLDGLARLRMVLERLEERDAPLFVHPGRAPWSRREEASVEDPLWWPALTAYTAQMQAAWLAFASAGRLEHPRLRVIFALLAGLAPLQSERLQARGARPVGPDPLSFYESSSYGPRALRAIADVVGEEQLVYGSDRPVVEPAGMTPAVSAAHRELAQRGERALGPAGVTR